MRLWLHGTLIVNIVILVAFLGYGAFAAHSSATLLHAEITKNTRDLAGAIAARSAGDLLTESYDTLEDGLRRQVLMRGVEELAVTDLEGRILAHVRLGKSNKAEPVYESLGQHVDVGHALQASNQRLVEFAPIELDGKLGWVRAVAGLESLQTRKSEIYSETLLAALLSALLTSALLVPALLRTGRSLDRCARFAGELVHQRGTTIAPSTRIAEIASLEASLNEVSQALTRQHLDLQDSESRKRAVLQATLDSLITFDANGRIVDWNQAAERNFGYLRDEVLGQQLCETILPAATRAVQKAGLCELQQQCMAGDAMAINRRIEITARRRDDSEFPVELSIVPFDLGDERYFLASLQDISERKALEAEQQRTASELRDTVSELMAIQAALDQHAIVSIADLDGTILDVNDKFCEVSGYSRGEVIGQNHRIVKSGLHDQPFYEDMWTTIAQGRVWHGEIVNRAKSGELYWVTSTIVPILDEHGVPSRYISVRTDITAQKRTERQLELSRRALEQSVDRYRTAEEALADARARELAIGNQIQRTLLSGEVEDSTGTFCVAVHTDPSTGIDGDFYEFFSHRPGCYDVVIGDVMGKGVTAALIGAAVKQQLSRVLARRLADPAVAGTLPQPAELMNDLHAAVTPRLIELESFVTLAYLRFELDHHRIIHVGAGHPSAILAGHDGITLLAGDNLPLGVMEEETYRQHETPIQPGDTIFLYSDGLTEARNPQGEEFGTERLGQLVAALNDGKVPASMIVQAVRKAAREFEEGCTVKDDRTCIALRQNELCSVIHAPVALELPWDLAELSTLRAAVDDAARAAGLSDDARDALILASFEAATNVIRHGSERPCEDTTLQCNIEEDRDALHVTLYYLGPPFVPDHDLEPDFSGESESGFGLFIIRSCVDDVVYDAPGPGVCRIRMTKNKGGADA